MKISNRNNLLKDFSTISATYNISLMPCNYHKDKLASLRGLHEVFNSSFRAYLLFKIFFTALEHTLQTFRHRFNVVFWLIRYREVGQRQFNFETTLCISTLEFTTSNNVESPLWILTLIWTTLGNIRTTFSFSAWSFTALVNVEAKL